MHRGSSDTLPGRMGGGDRAFPDPLSVPAGRPMIVDRIRFRGNVVEDRLDPVARLPGGHRAPEGVGRRIVAVPLRGPSRAPTGDGGGPTDGRDEGAPDGADGGAGQEEQRDDEDGKQDDRGTEPTQPGTERVSGEGAEDAAGRREPHRRGVERRGTAGERSQTGHGQQGEDPPSTARAGSPADRPALSGSR